MPAISYDPSLDRIDVALRAVVLISINKVWGSRGYRAQIGMTDEHRRVIQSAVQDLDNWRTEDGLFHLIRSCPCALGFALELMRLYTYNSRDYRKWFYARQGGRNVPDLSQVVS